MSLNEVPSSDGADEVSILASLTSEATGVASVSLTFSFSCLKHGGWE